MSSHQDKMSSPQDKISLSHQDEMSPPQYTTPKGKKYKKIIDVMCKNRIITATYTMYILLHLSLTCVYYATIILTSIFDPLDSGLIIPDGSGNENDDTGNCTGKE